MFKFQPIRLGICLSVFTFTFLAYPLSGMAHSNSTVSRAKIAQLVDDYYLAGRFDGPTGACPIDAAACINRACSYLGNFGCEGSSDALAVAKACRGNYNDGCLLSVCTKLGNFGCDTMAELTQVLQSCRGNIDGNCVNAVCAKLGNFGCDTLEEVTQVAESCGGGN